jgi:3-oxoacyl-[acyl-carrier protein] reductase
LRRAALVTGGSRGIGRAVVLELARRGVDVLFTYRRAGVEAAEVAAAAGRLPGDAHGVPYDLLAGNPVQLVGTAVERFGRLDTAILNAGIWDGGRLATLDPDRWWHVVETNLRGCHRLSRAAVPRLLDSDAGSLLLVSSAVALSGFPGDTAYASAKSAMIGFARSLARELGPAGARVNVLAPGFAETDMTAAISDKARAQILDRSVLRRFGTAEEIARAAVFLSEDATFTTGAVLTADGGWTI